MKKTMLAAALALALAGLTLAQGAQAQLAVSANDGKVRMDNGVVKTVPNNPDTVAIIDLGQNPPRLIAEIDAPTSIVGPPTSVAVAPDQSIALVTANMKLDTSNPPKQVPDNRMSVIDLTAKPPRVAATVETGLGPAGVDINRAGTLALVANREEGTVSVYTINKGALAHAGKVDFGNPKSGPSGVSISPDGKTALVSRDGDSRVSVLSIDGSKVEYTKRDIFPGQRPYGIQISSKGDIAVVANIGIGQGDSDTVSIIDMTLRPPRVIDTFSVGQTPEGIAMSPDGNYIAVASMNGSNKPANSPFYNPLGLLKFYKVEGKKATFISEVPTGVWTQGIAFSADGKTLLVQNKEQNELQVLRVQNDKLVDSGERIKTKNGGAGIRTR